MKRGIFMKRSFISILVMIIYSLVLIFIILSAVLVTGQALHNYRLCVAGTWVCLILYTFTKFAIFLFLVERIHVVRAPFVSRKNDKLYLGCLAMVIVMYGPVIINSYIDPVTSMGSSGTRCNFGIRGKSSLPVLAVNLFVDLVLTGVFFYLLRPVVQVSATASSGAIRSQSTGSVSLEDETRRETPVQRNIRSLLWKSIIGSLLIEIPMMANMIQFVITKGEQLGMICMALCVVEVVWDALVIHWLAFGPSAQAQTDLEHSVAASSKAPITRPRSSVQSTRMGVGETNKGGVISSLEGAEEVQMNALKFSSESRARVDSSADTITSAPQREKRIP